MPNEREFKPNKYLITRHIIRWELNDTALVWKSTEHVDV